MIALLEGSEFISVDLNEQSTKVRIELDMTNVDNVPTEGSGNLVKSGGVFNALVGKLNATKSDVAAVGGLVTPTEVLASNELVGVGVNGEQVRVQLGDGLALSGDVSPYTLSASGGGTQLYKHEIVFSLSVNKLMLDIIIYSSISVNITAENFTSLLHPAMITHMNGFFSRDNGSHYYPLIGIEDQGVNSILIYYLTNTFEYDSIPVDDITEGTFEDTVTPL